jgi:hypothetical protein
VSVSRPIIRAVVSCPECGVVVSPIILDLHQKWGHCTRAKQGLGFRPVSSKEGIRRSPDIQTEARQTPADEYRVVLRESREAAVQARIEKAKTALRVQIAPQPERKAAKSPPSGEIVCGDCGKTMKRRDYPIHDCRKRGGGHFVLGGAPGLSRRR